MKALAIARANLLRMLRDRSSIFFVFIFPLALVFLFGILFGGDFQPKLGVVAAEGDLTGRLVARLAAERRIGLVEIGDQAELLSAVERGRLQAGIVIPAGYDQALRAGDPVVIGFIARPDGVGPTLRATVDEAIADATAEIQAARFASEHAPIPFDEALGQANSLRPGLPGIEVAARTTGESLFPENLGRFDIGASSQLILFMFITALSGSAVLIQTRQLGVSRRMLSTPTSVGTVVIGEALGRFGVVLVQGVYIVIATLLAFGVSWGDPLGAIAVLVMFAAVGAGAAMLMGALFANDQQAGGFGVMFSLGLAALGGAMLPIELFSPTMQTVAHFTPHAWALDAFAELVRRDGTIVDILPELGVLAGFAVVLLALASWRLRAVITRV